MSSSNKVGFVSTRVAPKPWLTRSAFSRSSRSDGYDIVPTYDDADVVVVNTCGFIDSAKQESLEAIGEAISREWARSLVTGCMGKARRCEVHHQCAPQGTRAYPGRRPTRTGGGRRSPNGLPQKPSLHDPFVDLVPAQGIKLTPSTLRLLENLRGLQSSLQLLHHSRSMRGDLVSRPSRR